MNPRIEIVIVGNEILSGKTVDANAAFMRETLIAAGYDVDGVYVVGDDIGRIAETLRFAVGRSEIVLVSGGLGPTSDDVTIEAAAHAFGRKLILNERVLRSIEALFKRRKRFMSDSNKKQALLPEGAEALANPNGTAPGVKIAVGREDVSESLVFLMPGVPRELRDIFTLEVLPRITERHVPRKIETAVVSVTGISESELYDSVKHLPGAEKALAYYPRYTGIDIRIRTEEDAPMGARALSEEIKRILGDFAFSLKGDPLEKTVAEMLIEKGVTIAVAESCTGGLVAHRLTDIPGSSAYMLLGVVAYSNASKTNVLGVDPLLIEKHGAVSAEVAAAMAEGVRTIAGADIGLSTTGIAGPGGATSSKPVGLMFTGLSDAHGVSTKELQFVEDRRINKNRMSQAVIDILRYRLMTM